MFDDAIRHHCSDLSLFFIVFRVCCYSMKHSQLSSSHASWCSSLKGLEVGPIPPSILDSIDSVPPASLHIAKSHDDTTEGAVHCFQDEYGWQNYSR